MSRDIYTRCPNCHTVFRVTEQHLELAKGKVRCGACMSIFQATDHLMRPKNQAIEEPAPEPVESASSSFDKLAEFQPEVNVTDEGNLMHATAHAELDIHRSSSTPSEKIEYPIDSFAHANESSNGDVKEAKHEENAQIVTSKTDQPYEVQEDDDFLFDDDNGLEDSASDNAIEDVSAIESSLDSLLEDDGFAVEVDIGIEPNDDDIEAFISDPGNIPENVPEDFAPLQSGSLGQPNSLEHTDFFHEEDQASDSLPTFETEAGDNSESYGQDDKTAQPEHEHHKELAEEVASIADTPADENLLEDFLDDELSRLLDETDETLLHQASEAIADTSIDTLRQDPAINDEANFSLDAIDPTPVESTEDELTDHDYDPFDESNIEEALFQHSPEDYHTGELSMDQLNESLKDENFDPDPLDEFDEIINEKSHRVKWLAISSALVALMSWAGYKLWTDRQQLAWDDTWGSTVQTMCSILPCNIEPRRDVSAIELLQRTVQPSEESETLSEFSLILRNNASFAQPYPSIEIHFTDTNGESVTRQTYRPEDYLEPGAQQTEMPNGQRVYVLIKAKNPSANAFGFEFTFK